MKNHAVVGLIGLLTGFFFCWWYLVRPLEARLDAREKAIQEWERINRMEREAIANIKTINIEELRKWVATLDEQNTRYTKLQSLLHKQELALTGPATTHLYISLVAVIGTMGFVAWMMRDSNADAARTLNNAVAVLPSLREALQARQANPTAIEVDGNLVIESMTSPRLGGPTSCGRIVKYFDGRGFGFIRPEGGGEEIFFHQDQLAAPRGIRLRVGLRVSYQNGLDSRRRPCAKNVEVIDL